MRFWRTSWHRIREARRLRWRSQRGQRGQTVIEFVLIAGLLVGMAIALNSIIPPGLRQFYVRVAASISGVAP